MRASFYLLLYTIFFVVSTSTITADDIFLRDNLKKAQVGDYIVTAQNKTYTLLIIKGRSDHLLSFEEITVPMAKIPNPSFSWRNWFENGAIGHTCWTMYTVDLLTGEIGQAFSFTKNEWYAIPENQNFFSTLLNLKLQPIPNNKRKKVGPPPTSGAPDWRPFWQPRMTVEGKTIQGVHFQALRTRWPKDGTELANKSIEIYVPSESSKYPSYFPYWLQINGVVGKAKIRIIDSGSKLLSSKPPAHLKQSDN